MHQGRCCCGTRLQQHVMNWLHMHWPQLMATGSGTVGCCMPIADQSSFASCSLADKLFTCAVLATLHHHRHQLWVCMHVWHTGLSHSCMIAVPCCQHLQMIFRQTCWAWPLICMRGCMASSICTKICSSGHFSSQARWGGGWEGEDGLCSNNMPLMPL